MGLALQIGTSIITVLLFCRAGSSRENNGVATLGVNPSILATIRLDDSCHVMVDGNVAIKGGKEGGRG